MRYENYLIDPREGGRYGFWNLKKKSRESSVQMRRLLFAIALLTGFSAIGAVARTLIAPEIDLRHLMLALAIFASLGVASVVGGLVAPAYADDTNNAGND